MQNNIKLHFITFGGGSENYYQAVERLCGQVKSLEIFDSITGYTDKDIKSDEVFWNKHKNFIINNKRGYGYWIWKPYLILKKLKEINDNDILLYLDCGCEINVKQKKHFVNVLIPKVIKKKL